MRLLGTGEPDFSLALVQNLRRAMPPHSFTLLLHSRVDVRLAFVLCNLHARAVFLAFAVEANTAPIASRHQKNCKKGSGGEAGFNIFLAPGQSDANVRRPHIVHGIAPRRVLSPAIAGHRLLFTGKVSSNSSVHPSSPPPQRSKEKVKPENSGLRAAMRLSQIAHRVIGDPPPLRARGSFQCLVGNCVSEDIFLSLAEGVSGGAGVDAAGSAAIGNR